MIIPTDQFPAWVKCAVDKGFRVTKVKPPMEDGYPPRYELQSDLGAEQGMAVLVECRKLAPTPPAMTDARLRVIYDRWVGERDCLVRLGYQPTAAPSFELFSASWHTGPWMPIDGVDTGSWTDAQYQEAKQSCKLEFFERG